MNKLMPTTYGMRYYAAWIARFVSVDPLQFKYPELTPFQYAGNMPISNTDLDGAEPVNKVNPKFEGKWSPGGGAGTIVNGAEFNVHIASRAFIFNTDGNYTGINYSIKNKNNIGIVLNSKLPYSFILDSGQIYEAADKYSPTELMIKTKEEQLQLKNKGDNSNYITKFYTPSNKDLYKIIQNSGVYTKEAQNDPVGYVLRENSTGKMDAKFQYTEVLGKDTEYNTMFLIKNSRGTNYAENFDNFGNFIFGAECAALGFKVDDIKAGGHINNFKIHGKLDSADDQRSIERCYYWYFDVLSKEMELPKNKNVTIFDFGPAIDKYIIEPIIGK